MAQGSTRGIPIDTDITLAANSDLLVPSQKAVKAYVSGLLTNTFVSNITVNLSGTKSLGRFTGQTTILSAGKTVEQVLNDIAQEPIAPTVTLTTTTGIRAFNQTTISNVLNFSYTIKTVGATIASVALQWARAGSTPHGTGGTSTWVTLTTDTSLTTYTHTIGATATHSATGVTITTTSYTASGNGPTLSSAMPVNSTVTGAGFPSGAYLSSYTSTTVFTISYPVQTVAPTISGTFTVGDLQFNTNAFKYRYIATDSLNQQTISSEVTISTSSYVAPSISFSAPSPNTLISPETNTAREWGNTASSLQGSCSRNSVNVPIISYQYSVSINGGAYTNIGSSTALAASGGSFTTTSNTQAGVISGVTTTSITYKVDVVDQKQTTPSTYYISFSSLIFYGDINVVTTINSAAIRALPNRKFVNDSVNPFTFSSGTTNRRWLVAMDNDHTLNDPNGARDITQNQDLTNNFLPATSVSVNDGGGNARTYNLYNYTNNLTYSNTVTIQITYT